MNSFILWDMHCGRKDRKLFKNAMRLLCEVIEQTGDLTLLTDGERRYGRRAGRCWGLCRYRDLLHLKVHVRIPALEDGAQLPVERPHARL